MLLFIIFLSLAVAVSSQSNGVLEAVNHLICGENQCPSVDNSTAVSTKIDHLAALTQCVVEYNTEFSHRRCNLTSTGSSYPFCSLKEDGVFCSEILDPSSIVIPPTCVNISLCRSDCRTALLESFGCCLNMQLIEYPPFENFPELLRLQELCAFDVSYSCSLAIPEIPETFPVVQCTDQSIVNAFILEGLCKITLRLWLTKLLITLALNQECNMD